MCKSQFLSFTFSCQNVFPGMCSGLLYSSQRDALDRVQPAVEKPRARVPALRTRRSSFGCSLGAAVKKCLTACAKAAKLHPLGLVLSALEQT